MAGNEFVGEPTGNRSPIIDLTNTKWQVNAGWTATAGYGQFSIEGTTDGSTDYPNEIHATLDIGYTIIWNEEPSIVNTTDYIGLWTKAGNYKQYSNFDSFTLEITGGADATNTNLISWLTSNATQLTEEIAYLTFSSAEPFSLSVSSNARYEGSLEYSTDTVTWNQVTKGETISSENNRIYLRGNNNTKCYSAYHSSGVFTLIGSNIACTGNIETLLDYQTVMNGEHPVMANDCYIYMFNKCTNLVQAPELPATTLTERCYKAMFLDCSNLTTAPELPATTIAKGCYHQMFRGCTSLATVPNILPATTLAENCYYQMFYGCTSLTQGPELPAITLAYSCYSGMFSDCTNLTTAPELPATTLDNNCYYSMFSNCTNLTTGPSLPAMTMTNSCYRYMFERCTNLVQVPELPATALAEKCYLGMFGGCTSLTTASALPATALAQECYDSMFNGCTSLTTAPALPATTLAENCYRQMFSGCTNLTTAPELPATTLANNCYENMFYRCTSLTTAPVLPATALAEKCYLGMFGSCTSLPTAPTLPATTLANYCYTRMFEFCSSLTTIPVLPALTLAQMCYYRMFSDSKSIKFSTTKTGEYVNEYRIPYGVESGTTAEYALENMFDATGGTFTGSPVLNTTYYTSNKIIGTPIEPDTPDVPVEPVLELVPFLTNIANAIRAKKGTTAQINAQDFASEIASIEGGASSSAILDDGWTGTPVSLDASVVVENIYINTNLSVDEVVSILDNALSHYSADGAGQFGVFIHQGDTGNFGPMLFGIVAEGIYAILAGIDNDNQTMLFAYDTTGQGQDVAETGISGWNPDFNGIFEVNATNNISSMTNQEVNNQLSKLISITPFERVNITLNGVYQTNHLVIDHYGQYDLLESFVDDKVFIKTVDVNPQLDNATYSGEINIYNPTFEYQDQGGIVNFYGIKENFVISTLYSPDEAYSLIFMTIATNTEGMAWKLNNVEYSIGQTEQTDNGWFTTLKIKPLGESWTFHWLD